MLFLCAVGLCLIPLPATPGPSGWGREQRSQQVDGHMGLQGLPPKHGIGRSQASDGPRAPGKWGRVGEGICQQIKGVQMRQGSLGSSCGTPESCFSPLCLGGHSEVVRAHLTVMGAAVSPEPPRHLPSSSPEPGRWMCDVALVPCPEKVTQNLQPPPTLGRLEVGDEQQSEFLSSRPPAPFSPAGW